MPDPQTVLVTGGAGFIGSHLSDAFLAAGHRVVILDDLSSGKRRNVPESAELHILDIRSSEAADLARRVGPDLLVHQAAQMDVRRSVADPVHDADVNLRGFLNLLEAARECGTRRVLFASTGGAIYGEQDVHPAPEDHPARPVSPYGVAKLAGERYLYYYHHEHGFDVTCLRYANVYGERQNPHGEAGVVAIFLDRLLADEAVTINGDGMQTRDYVHVSNVVEANLAAGRASAQRLEAGEADFRIYNVGTGVETSVVELYRELAAAVGSDLEAAHGPAKPGEQRRSSVDASRLRDELAMGEPLPLPEGFRRTADWFRRRAAERRESGGE